MAEWFENETFWEGLYPFIFPSERLEAAAEEIDNVLDLVALEGGRVLDLCCGPGRHSVALARRGFDVTGVDRSRYLLEKAGEPAAGSGVEVEWIEADMRRFSRPDSSPGSAQHAATSHNGCAGGLSRSVQRVRQAWCSSYHHELISCSWQIFSEFDQKNEPAAMILREK